MQPSFRFTCFRFGPCCALGAVSAGRGCYAVQPAVAVGGGHLAACGLCVFAEGFGWVSVVCGGPCGFLDVRLALVLGGLWPESIHQQDVHYSAHYSAGSNGAMHVMNETHTNTHIHPVRWWS